jgi:hypothetical protein
MTLLYVAAIHGVPFMSLKGFTLRYQFSRREPHATKMESI